MSVKRFDGGNWVDAPTHKRYDGSNWVDAPSVKRYDGANWIETARNVVSPNDTMSLYYEYYVQLYSNYVWRVTCRKCGKNILYIQEQYQTGKYWYAYWKADGVTAAGTVDVSGTFLQGLKYPCQALHVSSGNTVMITKQQFKDKYYSGSYPYSNYDNMRYHENGNTRNMFTSDGYLICPWCE